MRNVDQAKRYALRMFLVVAGLWASAQSVHAAPRITEIVPGGLQLGATTSVTIRGSQLAGPVKCMLPGMVAEVKVVSQSANQLQIDVQLPATSLVPGIYPIRVATPSGISNPLLVSVDQLPTTALASDTHLKKLPAAVSGKLAGAQLTQLAFDGQAGQQVVVEVEAQRLGSALQPLLILRNPRGVQLAYSQQENALSGDARIAMKLPVDGTYQVTLHDDLFKATNPSFFRLKVGDIGYADQVFPSVAERGTAPALEFVSSNLPGTKSQPTDSLLSAIPTAWPTSNLPMSGPAPALALSEMPQAIEDANSDKLQNVAAPTGISGRLAQANEKDKYLIDVTPGSKLRVELTSHRLGTPLDGLLTISKPDGGVIATADDQADTLDPAANVSVPQNVSQVVVEVADRLDRGGEAFIYHLQVAPPQPDFELLLDADSIQVPRGGVAVVPVRVKRTGYNGPILLQWSELPEGVTAVGSSIPAGADEALLALQAGASDASAVAASLSQLVGKAQLRGETVQRVTSFTAKGFPPRQPWLRADLGIALASAPPLEVVWEDALLAEPLAVAAERSGDVQIRRHGDTPGKIRLSLLTSQKVPVFADGPNKDKPDMGQALRLAENTELDGSTNTATTQVLVPATLDPREYDVAVQAEILSADGKQVLSTSYSLPQRLTVIRPTLDVQLTPEQNVTEAMPLKISTAAGNLQPVSLSGTITREGEFAAPVTVSVQGLPKEVFPPQTVVPGDQTTFELALLLPRDTKVETYKKLKLAASYQLAPKSELTSQRTVPIELEVSSGGNYGPLVRLFDEEPLLAASFDLGDGTATADMQQAYHGSASLRFTGKERAAKKLPWLPVEIRQQPGEGEFRYLRFAWKKKGGNNVLLNVSAKTTGGQVKSQGYVAGTVGGGNSAELVGELPNEWTVVTRDLHADFGDVTLEGMSVTAGDGEAWLDYVYLARSLEDFPPLESDSQ